jgi:hypothetical protein
MYYSISIPSTISFLLWTTIIYGQYVSHRLAISQVTDNLYNDQPPVAAARFMAWRTDEQGDYNISVHDFGRDSTYCIANGNTNDVGLAINDHYLVWNAQSDINSEIMLYDLLTQTTYNLSDNLSDDLYPALDNHYIVWQRNNFYSSDIILYDLQTQKTHTLSNGNYNMMPQIADNFVVWKMKENLDSEVEQILLYDIKRHTTTSLASSKHISNLCIKGTYVAWAANQSIYETDNEIFLYDIARKTTLQVTHNLQEDNCFALLPPYLAFTHNDGNDDEIYLYQIDGNSSPQALTDNNTDDIFPVLNKHSVAWCGATESGIEIFLYPIGTGKTQQITCSGGFQTHATLNEEYLMWCSFDFDGFDTDIFKTNLPIQATAAQK